MINRENIWFVFQVSPQDSGKIHRQLLGKFLLTQDHFSILEDHGLPFDADDTPEAVSRAVERLANSMYFEVVSLHDMYQGHDQAHIKSVDGEDEGDLIQQLQSNQKLPAPTEFEYHRIGQPAPQILSVDNNGGVFLDGHALEHPEVDRVQETVRTGKATLRRATNMAKAEEDLLKVEPALADALGKLKSAISSGHVDPSVMQVINRQIFTDSMIPSVGNKKAYDDFLSRPRDGVHVHIDGNDFGDINKKHGFETGNKAIVAMGKAMRQAMDESVGRKNGKLFRVGGDEFVAHVPTAEHAAGFARNLRAKLEAIPAINGTHQLSVSMGFGHSKEHAEHALMDAKLAKKDSRAPVGQAATHVASRVPGRSGPIT